MSKWGDRPHWHFEGIHLGSDEHGEWIGFPKGTHNRRPGFEFDSEVDAVSLVPAEGWFIATFQAPGIWCDLYVDMATPATWDGDVLRAVDLDLDVVRLSDPLPAAVLDSAAEEGRTAGELFVDDEDEFAEHQVAYGYPADVIEAAQASRDQVFAAASARQAPYDGTHRRWLDELSRHSAS